MSTSPARGPVALLDWIKAHAGEFKPPVSNKVVFPGSELTFMVVRGPNARNDFHINPGDEIFYQLEGTIDIEIRRSGGEIDLVRVGRGEVFLVPGGTPHAPHRPAGTWGVVIERERRADEFDVTVWFCAKCGAELRRLTFHLSDIEAQLHKSLTDFNNDRSARTCGRCKSVLPVAEPYEARQGR